MPLILSQHPSLFLYFYTCRHPTIEDILIAHALWPHSIGHKHCLHKSPLYSLEYKLLNKVTLWVPTLFSDTNILLLTSMAPSVVMDTDFTWLLLRFYLSVCFALFRSDLLSMASLSQLILTPCIQYLSSKQNGSILYKPKYTVLLPFIL